MDKELKKITYFQILIISSFDSQGWDDAKLSVVPKL